jgi:hypothetical protein
MPLILGKSQNHKQVSLGALSRAPDDKRVTGITQPGLTNVVISHDALSRVTSRTDVSGTVAYTGSAHERENILR